jgi:hypothetical protein
MNGLCLIGKEGYGSPYNEKTEICPLFSLDIVFSMEI